MSLDEGTPARLLSGRDEPSVLEQEAIFEQVMRNVAPPKQRSPWSWAWAPGLVAAAAAVLFVVLPSEAPRPESEFTARGTGEVGVFAAHCADAQGGQQPCRAGMNLSIVLEPPKGRDFFALLARRPDGAVVWYYPKDGKAMPSVKNQRASEPWSETAHIADGAPAGSYSWVGVFAEEPMTREELKVALGDELRGNDKLTVLTRSIAVDSAP